MPEPIAKRLDAIERRRAERSNGAMWPVRFMPSDLTTAQQAAWLAEVKQADHRTLVVQFVSPKDVMLETDRSQQLGSFHG